MDSSSSFRLSSQKAKLLLCPKIQQKMKMTVLMAGPALILLPDLIPEIK